MCRNGKHVKHVNICEAMESGGPGRVVVLFKS